MKYYRVYTGYTEYIPIDSTEMEKAMFSFITGSPVALNNGATSRIDRIVPDYHRAMGWNPEHRMNADDWTQLKSQGIDENYRGAIGKAKDKIQHLIETKQSHLIGKNVKLPELEKPKAQITAALTSKLKV